MVKVDVSGEQTPKDYYVVRVQIVHVRKGLFGLNDKTIAGNAVIPNTRREAAEFFKDVSDKMARFGVSVGGE